jgi:hypothetical protein
MFNIVDKKERSTSDKKERSASDKKERSASDKKKKIIDPEDIKKLLVGYIAVPKQNWVDIPTDSHIRYIKSDGTFIRGGFVISQNIKNGKYFMYLTNNLYNSPNKKNWPVSFDNITTIYKKVDKNNSVEVDVIKAKNIEIIQQINKLVDVVKSQGIRIENLEQKLKKN